MKTFSKIFLAAIIIFGFTTSQTFASNKLEEMKEESNLKVAFLPQNIDQMVVSFEAQGENVQVNLKDSEGRSVHTESVSGRGVFAKRYDLSELDKGIYSFEVNNGKSSTTKTVVLK